MASDETVVTTTIQYYSSLHDATDDDADDFDTHQNDPTMFNYDVNNTELLRMSRLSIETSGGDADGELSDDDDGSGADVEEEEEFSWVDFSNRFETITSYTSLPGTPTRGIPRRRAAVAENIPPWVKEYSSETEVLTRLESKKSSDRKSRMKDQRRLDRAWEMKKLLHHHGGESAVEAESHGGGGGSSPHVVVRGRGEEVMMFMDLEELKACRDLGLGLPSCDWTVGGGSPPPPSSGGGDDSSPTSHWQISSPGDDPREVKARLRVWAQAVALASASHLSN